MTLTREGYIPRLIDDRISSMLQTFGAVCIEGPKWCGKTWTGSNHANSEINLADPANNFSNRTIASSNVNYALSGASPHLIDEWQEVPSIWDAIKIEVDMSRVPGKFILTGSSTPTEKGISHSGIGRIGTVKMRTMSLFESGDSDGSVSLRELFSKKELDIARASATLDHIIDLTVRGGWPGVIDKDIDKAMDLCQDYMSKIKKEARKLDGIVRDETKIEMLLRSLARNESTTAGLTTLAKDVFECEEEGISEKTISSYLDVLSRLFVIENQPAYSPSVRSPVRVGKSPRRHFIDPSLAIATLGLTPERLRKDMLTFGLMFESMCVRDLTVYAESLGGKVFHYRDDKGKEIDAIVEMPDGRWGAFEIKTGTDSIDAAANNLLKIRDGFDSKGWVLPEFLCIISGTSPAAYTRGDGVHVVPITCLRN